MKKYFIFILSILLFASCEKELEFTYHDIEPQLVIEGILDQEGIRVTLSKTTPMNEMIKPDYLTDGEVKIVDETDKSALSLNPASNGIYSAEYQAIPGNEYLLEVKRKGETYVSVCEMRPATKILDLKFQWIKMPYDYVAVLEITFESISAVEDCCYWLKLYRNGEPYKWIVSDNRSDEGGIIHEVVMTSRQDLDREDEKDILREGDEMKVKINTISREMFDYLTAIENDSNGPSMFTGDFCLGYFMASDSASDSIVFHPDEITYYK